MQSKLCDDWQLANSLKVHAELRFKCKLHPSHPGWSWVVRHASWLHNRFHVKANGRTCFEELHQTRYKQDVVPWAEKVLFMEPRPKHRRLKGGRRAQKMGAAMEPGIWLGRTEESDEHLVGTARGVLRARTVRRMTPDKRWDSELFFGFRGVPWDVTADALPAKPRSKVMVHFTMPSSEVVPQPDGSNLTHGGDAVEPQAVGEDRSSGYAPTTPLGRSEPGDVGFESPAEGEESPSRAAGYLTPASPRSPSHKRQGSEPDRPTKTQVVEDESPGQGSKRRADTPAEALDPRTEDYQEGISPERPGGVLQVYETVDEAPAPVPDEAWDLLESDDLVGDPTDHPDTWDEERWGQEMHNGKARELKSLADYQVYVPVPREESHGKKFITTRWEEVPKWKQGRWIVRSRFVAREFRWKDPGRDDLFGVTSSANTGRILDYLLTKKSLRV